MLYLVANINFGISKNAHIALPIRKSIPNLNCYQYGNLTENGGDSMGQPVTTNPVIIMMINMTIVFAVLIGLQVLVQLIHVIDPTKKKA